MFNNKKGSIIEITGWILLFSLVSVIYLFVAILNFVVINDYVIYNMQNITETLEEKNLLKAGISDITQQYGDQFTNFNFHFDDLWFLAYAIFFISSLSVAYQTKPQNYFGFFSFLFYGVMFILFVLTLYSTITEWFYNEIFLAMIPTAIIHLPKFTFYLDHIGIFSAVQIVICLLVNLLDFDFSKIKTRKKQELKALSEEEVL